MLICDADENVYEVISLCLYNDVYEDDIISIYGLPIGKTAFDNVSGGTTLAIVVAASYVEKIA